MDRSRLERLLSILQGTATSDHLLRRICVVGTITTGADGAGLSSFSGGAPRMVVASDAVSASIEHLQEQLREGPCLDALASMEPALEPWLSGAEARRRWPAFSPRALDEGAGAVFAFPVVVDGRAIGALDLYARTPGELSASAVDDARMLADLAGLTIDTAGSVEGASGITEVGLTTESAHTWVHASVVHNASGMIAVQLGVAVDEALLRLRAFAFAADRSVADVARDVVTRRLRLGEDHDRG